jgi:hypothetical protein
VELHEGEAEGAVRQLHIQAEQGDQKNLDYGHHPGLLQESVQLHAQEYSTGIRCRGRVHKLLKICLKYVKYVTFCQKIKFFKPEQFLWR